MADNFNVVTANGTSIATFRATDVGGGLLAMMSIPTNTSGTAMIGQALMANSLSIAIASNQSPVPVSGTITAVIGTVTAVVSGTVTAVVSNTITAVISNTAAMNIVQFGGVAVSLGQAVMATSIPVAIASNQGAIPVTIANGADVTLGTTGDTAWVVGAGTVVSVLKAVASNVSGSIPAGTAFIGSVGLTQINGSTISLGQVTMASSFPVAIASNQSSIPVAGDIASGSADSGNPLKLGAVAHTAAPTAVADGQRVNLIADKVGRLQAVGAPRSLLATQTTALTTTGEATIINPLNATTFADVYGLVLANTGATTTKVDLRYGTGSAIVMTFEVPATDTRGFMLPVDSAIPGSLSTANVSWTAQMAATTNMSISAFYVKNI